MSKPLSRILVIEDEPLSPVGILAEELPEMAVADLLVVLLDRHPGDRLP